MMVGLTSSEALSLLLTSVFGGLVWCSDIYWQGQAGKKMTRCLLILK